MTDEADEEDKAPEAWDRFWKYDRLSSLGACIGAPNYSGEMADSWRRFFAGLPDRSAILDLCTGNGAIAVIAVQTAEEKGLSFHVTGVDSADIDPTAYVTCDRGHLGLVRFLPRTSAERLPMAASSFDALSSQFGIEYSNLDVSIPEVLRVLKPRGRLRFIVHAADGAIASNTRKALDDADFLLDDVDLSGRAERCFAAVMHVEHGDCSDSERRQAEGHFAAFREGLKTTADRFGSATDVAMLRNVHSVLYGAFQHRHLTDAATLIAKAAEVRAEILAHRLRQQALLDAAMGRDDLDRVSAVLDDHGMTVTVEAQRSGDAVVGHAIEAARGG